MDVPSGSAHGRRSRTIYRPTVTPEGSNHVDTAFTDPTSSFSRTDDGTVALVAVVRPWLFRTPGDTTWGPAAAAAGPLVCVGQMRAHTSSRIFSTITPAQPRPMATRPEPIEGSHGSPENIVKMPQPRTLSTRG